MKSIAIYLIIALFTIGCVEESAEFLEPQPRKVKNSGSFPQILWGNYKPEKENQSEKISIDGQNIINHTSTKIALSLIEVDTTPELVISNDSLIDLSTNFKFAITIKNDSVFGIMYFNDTLFSISDNNLLRKTGKFYILNKPSENNFWNVAKLTIIDDNKIEIALIHKKKEAKLLKYYTTLYDLETNGNEIKNYKLNPKRREFKKMLLSLDLFTDKEVYIRID